MTVARFKRLKLGAGLAGTAVGSDVIQIDVSGPTGSAGGVLDGSYPNPGLAAAVAGAGLTETSDVLSVNTDGVTLEVSADAVRVKDGGVTSAKIADGTIVDVDVSNSAAIDPTKLSHPGGTTTFLRADATWADPAAAGGGPQKLFAAWGGAMPAATGVGLVWRVPYDTDGSSITFDYVSAYARIESTHGGSVVFRIEESPGGDSAFAATTVTTITIPAGDYETENTGLTGSVASGELLRLVYVTVGPTTNFQVELQAVEP